MVKHRVHSTILQWRHNERHNVPNHRRIYYLLNRLSRHTLKRKHQSSASPAFLRGIHRRPVDSPPKWPVTRRMFPFDDVTTIVYMVHAVLCFFGWFKPIFPYPSGLLDKHQVPVKTRYKYHLMVYMKQRTTNRRVHYSDVIMGATASQITSLTTVYSAVYSGVN